MPAAPKLAVRPLDTTEWATWNALVAASPFGTVYHDTRWLAAICRAARSEWYVLGAFADNALCGGLPLAVRRCGPLSIARRAYATPYAGPLESPQAESSWGVTTALLEAARRRHSRVEIAFTPEERPPILPGRWGRHTKGTFLHDISPAERFWSGMACEARNIIRRAERNGVTITSSPEPCAFDEVYRGTFARQGLDVPFEPAATARLLAEVQTQGVGVAYLALTREGHPCAAGLVLYDARTAHYSLAGSDAEGRRLGAPSLLVWEAIQKAAQHAPRFDFGGANVPAITQFKRQFHGVFAEYDLWIGHRSSLERGLLFARERFASPYALR